MANLNLFRKNALNKALSPNELKHGISIVSPKDNLVLFVLGVAVITMLLWSILGVIYERSNGNGIIMLQSRFDVIQNNSGGVLVSVDIQSGDVVQRGQIVARIFAMDDLEKLRVSYQKLKLLQDQLAVFSGRISELKANQQEYYKNSQTALESYLSRINDELDWYEQYIAKMSDISHTGVVSELQLNDNIAQLHGKLKNRDDFKLQLLNNRNDEIEQDFSLQKELLQLENQVGVALLEVEQIRNTITYNSRVISNYSGTVTGVNYSSGSIVTANSNIATVVALDDEEDEIWELYAYFPLSESKKIKTGMPAIITPTSVKAETDGSIRGTVSYVGSYMQPPEAINRTFHNSSFAQYVLSSCENMPVEVRISLSRDFNSPNGFRWTSGLGPNIEITAGTLCTAMVVVDEQPPLELIFSGFRKFLFGYGVNEELQKESLNRQK